MIFGLSLQYQKYHTDITRLSPDNMRSTKDNQITFVTRFDMVQMSLPVDSTASIVRLNTFQCHHYDRTLYRWKETTDALACPPIQEQLFLFSAVSGVSDSNETISHSESFSPPSCTRNTDILFPDVFFEQGYRPVDFHSPI